MKRRYEYKNLDELISRAISREEPKFDFDKWKQTHRKEIEIYESEMAKRQNLRSSQPFHAWRIIMKSPMTKMAAAVVLIIAVLFGIFQLGNGSVTFADVIKPILNAQTVVVDMLTGEDETGPVIHDIVKDSRIRRTMSNMPGMTQILDLQQGKMLVLNEVDKTAAYVDIEGPLQEGTRSYVGLVQETIAKLKDHPEWPVTELGQQEIDGQIAVGFNVNGRDQQLTVWADPKMAVPVRIELRRGQSVLAIFKNIKFDVPIDESQVSMNAPDGYILHEAELNLGDFNEQDFIETLRMWPELLLDGKFPDRLSAEYIMKQVPIIGVKIDQLDISDEEKVQRSMQLGRGLTFFQFLRHQNKWHYAGKDVKLGDVETPIFWYRPEDSKTWRVIYGDLSVKDVAPENLPKLDDDKYSQMTPVEVAQAFFQACKDENWDEVLKLDPVSKVPQWLKNKYGGLEIISIGEPFKTDEYDGWYLPYEIRLKSGRIKKWNLALRYGAKGLQVDGGL